MACSQRNWSLLFRWDDGDDDDNDDHIDDNYDDNDDIDDNDDDDNDEKKLVTIFQVGVLITITKMNHYDYDDCDDHHYDGDDCDVNFDNDDDDDDDDGDDDDGGDGDNDDNHPLTTESSTEWEVSEPEQGKCYWLSLW